eukprot:5955165-Pyramimonas_sp.AAC.1
MACSPPNASVDDVKSNFVCRTSIHTRLPHWLALPGRLIKGMTILSDSSRLCTHCRGQLRLPPCSIVQHTFLRETV